MASDCNFMQPIAQQLSSGTSYKSVSDPAGSKLPGSSTGKAGAHNSETNFKRTLQTVSDKNASSKASHPADNPYAPADEDGLQTDGFSDVAKENVVQAYNLIGGHDQHQAAGDAPAGEPDAALEKIQLLQLLKKLGFEDLSSAKNGNRVGAAAQGEPVNPTQAGGDEAALNTAEIAKLVQQLTAKPDTALGEGNMQHSGIRNLTAAMISDDKAVMAEVAKTATSDGSNNQSLSNDGRPLSQANALNEFIQDAQLKKGVDSGANPADSNLSSNPSTPKTETNLQTAKTVSLRPEATAAIEMGGKIVNPDAAKEEGFSFSQQQSELKTLDGQQFGKASENIPNDVRSQTLDQIVQKAVLHFKNGQNEVQLNLKPDFLGHIRMQIITESQQVTVRILTEYPMVKELIENNIQQLKSSLQQYGLEIDELEVSVAHDSEQHVADRHKASGSKPQNPSEDGDTDDKTGSENTAASALQTISDAENTTIDFFA